MRFNFALLGDLKDAGLLPVNRERLAQAIAHCDRTLETVAEMYREKLAPAIARVWHSEIEDLRTDLRGWLQQAAQNDDDWQPIHLSSPLDLSRVKAATLQHATEAVLSEGVRLRGSIDMVERNPFYERSARHRS